MFDAADLRGLHARAHRNVAALLEHCGGFSQEELDREFEGFGIPSVRAQLHHALGAEKYWIGVLEGRIDVEEDPADAASVEALEAFRARIFDVTDAYLAGASPETLNTVRPLATWGGAVKDLVPAHVFLRTFAHLYHHQGQVTALCRLLGRPTGGLDYPLD